MKYFRWPWLAFWFFLMFGSNPVVVGPFQSKHQCELIRSGAIVCPANADCQSIPQTVNATACWSDGNEPHS